ncbi:hypothetical protein FRC09_004641 [Ceratobasidium sp. 395]|nr:hypothetical protein FRC09_004641 [Ceratobasidium sp. 395]
MTVPPFGPLASHLTLRHSKFDPITDVQSFVPVSGGAVLPAIVAAYRRRASDEKPKIPVGNQLVALVRWSFYDTLDGVTKGKEVKPP